MSISHSISHLSNLISWCHTVARIRSLIFTTQGCFIQYECINQLMIHEIVPVSSVLWMDLSFICYKRINGLSDRSILQTASSGLYYFDYWIQRSQNAFMLYTHPTIMAVYSDDAHLKNTFMVSQYQSKWPYLY